MKFHTNTELTIGEKTTVLADVTVDFCVITRGTDQERPARPDEVSVDDLDIILKSLRHMLSRANAIQADGEGQS